VVRPSSRKANGPPARRRAVRRSAGPARRRSAAAPVRRRALRARRGAGTRTPTRTPTRKAGRAPEPAGRGGALRAP